MNQSLTNIKRLCEFYNHPERSFATIHVAGTNGKGSVCTKIASVLHNEGYVTGLYTSPHISTFRERIKIGDQMISEEAMSSLFSELHEIVVQLNISATFFEIATCLSFLYFQRSKVDIAVIETGLGGTWDATNVIQPVISIITSIGLDHTDVLGTSIEAIAKEKAGIIKKTTPVVIGPDVPYLIMKEQADSLGAPLYQSTFQDEDFDKDNQGTAKLALSILSSKFPVSEKSIHIGLQAKPPCRFERHFLEKTIILDVAHNAHGFARLMQMLFLSYPHHRYRFVVGFSKGKDIFKCAKIIQKHADAIHLVSGSHPRLAKVEDIQTAFMNMSIPLYLEDSIDQGVQHALQAKDIEPEIVVVAGSFFIMAEARKSLKLHDAEDPCIWYDPMRVLV